MLNKRTEFATNVFKPQMSMAKIWLILCFYVYVKLNSLILAVVNGDETLFLIRSYVTVGRNRKFH